jgi:hypothetical protein
MFRFPDQYCLAKPNPSKSSGNPSPVPISSAVPLFDKPRVTDPKLARYEAPAKRSKQRAPPPRLHSNPTHTRGNSLHYPCQGVTTQVVLPAGGFVPIISRLFTAPLPGVPPSITLKSDVHLHNFASSQLYNFHYFTSLVSHILCEFVTCP